MKVYLTLGQVAKRYPGKQGQSQLSPSTVSRWILTGCPGRSGTRVKLRATRGGGRWLIEESDLEAFFAALNDVAPTASSGTSAAVRLDTPAKRKQASDRAARELERRGA